MRLKNIICLKSIDRLYDLLRQLEITLFDQVDLVYRIYALLIHHLASVEALFLHTVAQRTQVALRQLRKQVKIS